LGGLNPSFFVIWGGLAPPSPYVEPPLVVSKTKQNKVVVGQSRVSRPHGHRLA